MCTCCWDYLSHQVWVMFCSPWLFLYDFLVYVNMLLDEPFEWGTEVIRISGMHTEWEHECDLTDAMRHLLSAV